MTAEPFPCIDARAAWRDDPAQCMLLYRVYRSHGFAATRRAYGWTRAAMVRALRVGKAFALGHRRVETAFWHEVSGRRYVSIRGEPRHATMASYRQCVADAYGSLSGVKFGTFEREA